MPRRYLPSTVDSGSYHVYSRGVEKRQIFLADQDYARFLRRMKEYAGLQEVIILEYCLMPNHFHILIRAETPFDMFRYLHRLCTAYAMYFNRRYARVGPLFQSRYCAKVIDSDEYYAAVREYIKANPATLPVRHSYPWVSSPRPGLLEARPH